MYSETSTHFSTTCRLGYFINSRKKFSYEDNSRFEALLIPYFSVKVILESTVAQTCKKQFFILEFKQEMDGYIILENLFLSCSNKRILLFYQDIMCNKFFRPRFSISCSPRCQMQDVLDLMMPMLNLVDVTILFSKEVLDRQLKHFNSF